MAEAGSMNAESLKDECRLEATIIYNANSGRLDEELCGVLGAFSVMRRRGLINLQGLELIKKSGEAK